MKLEQMKHLIEIEKQKSISKAAKVLYIGQSTLSASLTSLEDEIGVRLFERTFSGVIPTAEGKEAVQLAKQAMDINNRILELGKGKKEILGSVTVAIGQSYSFLMTELFLEFKEKYPKAELNLQICSPEELIIGILEGYYDIALLLFSEYNQKEMEKFDFQIEKFENCVFKLYVGKNNKLASQNVVQLDKLKQEKFIINSPSFWKLIAGKIEIKTEGMRISDYEMINRLISETDYITLMPDLFERKNLYCEYGLIKAITVEDETRPVSATAAIIYPKQRSLRLLEQRTLDLLRELLKNTSS